MDTQRTPTTLDEVRLAIFRQHTQLAQLLDELELHAKAVLDGSGEARALNDALEVLNIRFTRHLAYEEPHLAKWLPRAPSLLGDHDDQRLRMEGLVHDRAVFEDPRTLAHEALAFVRVVRADMVDEDRKLRALRAAD